MFHFNIKSIITIVFIKFNSQHLLESLVNYSGQLWKCDDSSMTSQPHHRPVTSLRMSTTVTLQETWNVCKKIWNFLHKTWNFLHKTWNFCKKSEILQKTCKTMQQFNSSLFKGHVTLQATAYSLISTMCKCIKESFRMFWCILHEE